MESHEAVMENVMRDMQSAQRQGFQTAAQIIRCEDLRSRRAAIDAAGQAVARKEERFQIRQDQFKLNCKNN